MIDERREAQAAEYVLGALPAEELRDFEQALLSNLELQLFVQELRASAEAIPFASLTQYDVPSLYALKGEIVRRGVKAVTGFDMPVFPKRRFQHGAIPEDSLRARIGADEAENRRRFYGLFA